MFNTFQFNTTQFDSTLVTSSSTGCPCNEFDEIPTGGIVFSGTPTSTDDIVTGGLTFSGTPFVDLVQDPFDGLSAYYLLGELASGVSGEYLDSTRNALNGTGGGSVFTPSQDSGILCRHSQHFDGVQYITIPSDRLIPSQDFSVSLWARIETSFLARTWYSRGFDTTTGGKWTVSFGHSFLSEPVATVRKILDGNVTSTSVQSSIAMEPRRWHHVAFAYAPGGLLSVYLDGVLTGTRSVSSDPVLTQTNGGYIGRLNRASLPTGNIQTLAVHPVARDQTWFLTEYRNACVGITSQGAETVV